MSSIIERPWAEEAFMDIRSEHSNQTDSSTTSEAEAASRDFRSGTNYEPNSQSYPFFNSEGSKSEKTRATAAARGQHKYMMFSVTKGASISPFYMIICGVCGKEMDNTLMCPRCKREMPGHLIDNICKFCDDVPCGHKSDSCPRKDNPVCYELPSLSDDESDDDIALRSDYEPSSP